jgi:hypothetical protein
MKGYVSTKFRAGRVFIETSYTRKISRRTWSFRAKMFSVLSIFIENSLPLFRTYPFFSFHG